MDKELEKTITWQEFQERKDQERRKILQRAATRVESGYSSHYSLDLDMLPIINELDKIPFSFTIFSCSGTPKEHRSEEYSPVNGLKENPDAILYAHSYMVHPLFPKFKDLVERIVEDKADLSKSCAHGGKGYEGIYLHIVNIRVPEEIKQKGDLEYLDRFWKYFKSGIEDFVLREKPHRMWEWEPPTRS